MGDCRLTASELACVRGGRMLFAGVDFDLVPGDALHIAGPNGIGKSSLMRVLAGLLPAFSGMLEVAGERALVDERIALDLHWTLARALGFWARLDGRAGGVGDGAVAAAMRDLDLANLADVPLRMFSTGQRKRAALARLLASNAPIWLMDEPANGLDTASTARLGDMVARHRATGGIVVAASHLPLPIEAPQSLALADYARLEFTRGEFEPGESAI